MKKYYFTSEIRGIVGEHSGNIRGAKTKAQKFAEQFDEEITILVRSNKEIDCGKNIPANEEVCRVCNADGDVLAVCSTYGNAFAWCAENGIEGEIGEYEPYIEVGTYSENGNFEVEDYSSIDTCDGMWNIINDYCDYVDTVCPETIETVETEEKAEEEIITMGNQNKNMKEVIEMTETMVNGIIFKVWSDFNAKCTLAENEDGDVRIIQSAGYISNDLTIRKAIAMVFGLPTFRKNAVKTAKAVEETPVTKSKEQDEQETVEGISKTETTTEMDDSGKDANNTDFQQQLYNAEYNKTFTVQGGIERFLKLAKEFVKNKSAEISLIVDTAAQVLHDKYGLDYGTIETLEIEAYNS